MICVFEIDAQSVDENLKQENIMATKQTDFNGLVSLRNIK